MDKKTKNRILPLFQPALVDLSGEIQTAQVEIIYCQHRFALDAKASGRDQLKCPIFGSIASMNNCIVSKVNFGLPFFRLRRGTKPKIKFINRTQNTFVLHQHGMNLPSEVDGAATELMYGVGTKIGTEYTLQYPVIQNNSALLWIHSHTMFSALAQVQAGLSGLVDIVDEESSLMQKFFVYGNNRILLKYQDLDLNSDGTYSLANAFTDENRACFGAVNGVSCVNWYTDEDDDHVPFVTTLHHQTTSHLVKIDFLNNTNSFRYVYLGVCTHEGDIQPFYLVQTDGGLRNPVKLSMIEVGPAIRVALMVDTSQFPKGQVHLFFYNFDLTNNFGVTLKNPPLDPLLEAPVPDMKQTKNPTPNPTPIPAATDDPSSDDPSALDYPTVPVVPQVTEIVPNGKIVSPLVSGQPFTMKRFLQISYVPEQCSKGPQRKKVSLRDVIRYIRTVVFGTNYCILMDQPNFEYQPGLNYEAFLNPNYFYNLPSMEPSVPMRTVLLFGDDDENSQKPYGSTEYISEANRIFHDMWTSDELDLNYALLEYAKHPNRFKPTLLPSCLFGITPTLGNEEYSNMKMIVNDTLHVEVYAQKITYQANPKPIGKAIIVFPPTIDRYLNIAEWQRLVMKQFHQCQICICEGRKRQLLRVSELLRFDWSFFPFRYRFLREATTIIKSVIMLLKNRSSYHIRLRGRWPLLQFFGNPSMVAWLPCHQRGNRNGCALQL